MSLFKDKGSVSSAAYSLGKGTAETSRIDYFVEKLLREYLKLMNKMTLLSMNWFRMNQFRISDLDITIEIIQNSEASEIAEKNPIYPKIGVREISIIRVIQLC